MKNNQIKTKVNFQNSWDSILEFLFMACISATLTDDGAAQLFVDAHLIAGLLPASAHLVPLRLGYGRHQRQRVHVVRRVARFRPEIGELGFRRPREEEGVVQTEVWRPVVIRCLG